MTNIETQNCKDEQLAKGYFKCGSGREVILIVGSCRTLHLVNYLNFWNETHGNRFTICRIDPHDFHWNAKNELVDLEFVIRSCETDERILTMLGRVSIYIHEYYAYYGMFNSSTGSEKNLYQFGLLPRLDITIPNFHDKFIMFQEQVEFDNEIRTKVQAHGGISPEIFGLITARGFQALEKFYDICRKSSFPEMADDFQKTWRNVRYFTTSNHITKRFSQYIFQKMNERFLQLPVDLPFFQGIESFNQFSTPAAPVTNFDIAAYGLNWGVPIEPIKIP